MPRRKEILANGEYYHIYNRGVEKRPIFQNTYGYQRFCEIIEFYIRDHGKQFSKLTHQERQEIISTQKGTPLVEIACYILMPNHYHLALKQVADYGISKYIQKCTTAHSRYFNIRHDRVGPLFQGKFQSLHIDDDAQLLHLSRYIHTNPVTAHLVKKPEDYRWSSYHEYLGTVKGFCNKDIILGQFKSPQAYQTFVEDYLDYQKKLAKIEHLLIEKEP